MDKERLRRFHGIPESTSQADLKVLSRRRFHEKGAKWIAKWSGRISIFFVLVGFFVVLLPTLSKSVRNIIVEVPVVSTFFHDYSTLSGVALVSFFILAFFAVASGLISKSSLGGCLPLGVTYKEVVVLELYPMTKKEELAFWINLIYSAFGSTIFFLPFSILAFFIGIGV